MTRNSLTVLPGMFAVCRLEANAGIPAWATTCPLFSVTRTLDELSIVCNQAAVPAGVQCEGSWRCIKLAGPIPFSSVGVLAELLAPLADAGISVFAISTFDTDYLLVKQEQLEDAVIALRQVGHKVA